jgi:hypothetical protein
MSDQDQKFQPDNDIFNAATIIMKSNSLIRSEGMNILIKNWEVLETECFIMLIRNDIFGYTP